jgi:hypothetical protein
MPLINDNNVPVVCCSCFVPHYCTSAIQSIDISATTSASLPAAVSRQTTYVANRQPIRRSEQGKIKDRIHPNDPMLHPLPQPSCSDWTTLYSVTRIWPRDATTNYDWLHGTYTPFLPPPPPFFFFFACTITESPGISTWDRIIDDCATTV